MKKVASLFLTVVLAFALASVAFAHSGGTDSKGGHTDRSTGEYHYHHGYSAHQHEDLDGDGDLDCPYDFVDKTVQSSGSTYRSSYSSNTPAPVYTPRPTPRPTPTPKVHTEMTLGLYLLAALFFGLPAVGLIGGLYLYIIEPIVHKLKWRKEVARKAEEYRRQQERLRQVEKEFLGRHQNGRF